MNLYVYAYRKVDRYIHNYECLCICIHKCIYAYLSTHIASYPLSLIYTYIPLYSCQYINIDTHTYKCHACLHIHMYVHSYI